MQCKKQYITDSLYLNIFYLSGNFATKKKKNKIIMDRFLEIYICLNGEKVFKYTYITEISKSLVENNFKLSENCFSNKILI